MMKSPLEICILSSTQEIRPSLMNFRNLNARAYRDHLMERLSTTYCAKKKKKRCLAVRHTPVVPVLGQLRLGHQGWKCEDCLC